MKPHFFHKYPLSCYLILAICLILMIAVAGLIGISYLSMEETLEDNARGVQLQTENNLVAVFKAKEEGLRLFEESLDDRMEEAFIPFLAEYERSGRDPSRMDLEAVKSVIGGGMELYVIDANATITVTTYAPEAGLRFREYAPYFADYLDTIRRSQGFFPDRIVSEKSTGAMKKFAYMPTPDNGYVLELGLDVTVPDIAIFRYLDEDLVMDVERSNPYLAGVRVFDSTLRQRNNDTSVDIEDPALKSLLAAILANRTTVEMTGPDDGLTTRYLFVDLKDDLTGSDVSRIVELTYTDLPVRKAMESGIAYFLSIGAVALVLCAMLAVVAVRNLTHPIERMVEDVNAIAAGDLDHPIAAPIGRELRDLEESITRMVSRLKGTIVDLRESEENYRTLMQNANSIIMRCVPGGTILYMNPYGRHFFGFPGDDVAGKNVQDIVIPATDEGVARMRTVMNRFALEPGPLQHTESENITRDGRLVWLAWTNTPIYDEQGNIVEVLSIGNDITSLKAAEEDLQTLNDELEQRVTERTRQLVEVNRNLESFTYSVSHDLRAPLRAISGYSSILLHELDGIPQRERRYLEMVRQNAHDMGRLIDDLLNFSKLGAKSLQKQLINPAMIFRDAFQEMGRDADTRNVEFRIGTLPPCRADPVLFRQLCANLLSNALKFSQNQAHPVVEIGSVEKDGNTVYFIRDNGIGLDMRYAGKIFGVFERLHTPGEYEGTGVGLAIVQRIIEMHGGSIWVESAPGEGATFFFTI